MNKPTVAIIATSLNPDSRSQILAQEAKKRLDDKGADSFVIDLRETPLPMAGSNESWDHPKVQALKKQLTKATHIIFSVPIYNYDVNAAAKNLVELLGYDAFENKTVGFICTAGGKSSYMSVLSFANSLMLDFRCWIVPRYLYVTPENSITPLDQKLRERLDGLIEDLMSHQSVENESALKN